MAGELEKLKEMNEHLKMECQRHNMDNSSRMTSYEKERQSLLK